MSGNHVRRGCLADVAVNKNELSVNVMAQPCADKAGEQVSNILGSFGFIYAGFYCRLPTESAQPALTDVEPICNSCYIFNVFFTYIHFISSDLAVLPVTIMHKKGRLGKGR